MSQNNQNIQTPTPPVAEYKEWMIFKPTGNSQIDRLNILALKLAKNQDARFGVLSKGEQCYAALASNRVDLLESIGYTIPEALARLGDEWIAALISSWQYAGNPAKYESAEAV